MYFFCTWFMANFSVMALANCPEVHCLLCQQIMNYNQITQISVESGDNIENDLLNLDQMKGLSVMWWTPKIELQFISLGLHLTLWHHIQQPVLFFRSICSTRAESGEVRVHTYLTISTSSSLLVLILSTIYHLLDFVFDVFPVFLFVKHFVIFLSVLT